MKKTFLILVCLIFVLVFAPGVYSQESTESATIEPTLTPTAKPYDPDLDFDKVFQLFKEKQEEYEKAHDDYIIKKAQYLRFRTLKSQTDAIAATLNMLQKRDDVVIYYIKSVRAKLDGAIGISDARREGIDVRLEAEIIWFSNHKEKVSSAGSLSDLVADSKSAETRYSTGATIFYETLSVISLGKINVFKERIQDLFVNIKERVEIIKKEEREEYKLTERKIQILDRWILESDNKIARGVEKQSAADSASESFSETGFENALSQYNRVLYSLGEAQLFYREGSSFLKEVVKEVMIAEE